MSRENSGLVPEESTNIRLYGLFAGPLFALLVFFIVPEHSLQADGAILTLGMSGKVTAALAVWMAVWWLSEAISIYATALLPMAILPLAGAQTVKAAATAYAHPLIFLFLGGFILALALERWHLHKRFALFVLRVVGTSPRRLVGGFMLSSAIMSMWITNTATTIVMLPIALSVIAMESDDAPHKKRFAICLLLGIAYAASIGGIGTIVGTTPNMFTVSFIENELGQTISFLGWMMVGVPLVIVFIPLTWFILTRIIFHLPAGSSNNYDLDTTPAPWDRGSVLTLVIFALTAFGWIARPLLTELPFLTHLSDAGIAIIAALALFAIPENLQEKRFLMDWETAIKVPWGVLLILGGGLCLAGAIRANGVAELLAIQLNTFGDVPPLVMTLLIVTMMIFLTELTSNVATTTALIPIIATIATALGIEPLKLVIPATMAASCAFMLPAATPPNAIVFGSGIIRIPDMAKAGIWLNLTGVITVTVVCHFVLDIALASL